MIIRPYWVHMVPPMIRCASVCSHHHGNIAEGILRHYLQLGSNSHRSPCHCRGDHVFGLSPILAPICFRCSILSAAWSSSGWSSSGVSRWSGPWSLTTRDRRGGLHVILEGHANPFDHDHDSLLWLAAATIRSVGPSSVPNHDACLLVILDDVG